MTATIENYRVGPDGRGGWVTEPAPADRPTCGFCKNEGVRDGRELQDGKARPSLACPRCGVRITA